MITNPDAFPEPAPPGPLVRFLGTLRTVGEAAVESLNDPANRSAASAWLKDMHARAVQTPAEDIAAAIVRAVGTGIAVAKDVLESSLATAK